MTHNVGMFVKLHANQVVRCLHEIDLSELAARGVRGVLIDMDNTLTPWRSHSISPEIELWIGKLHELGMSACLVSNAATVKRVRPVADRLEIPYVTRAAKPLARGFRKGMKLLKTTPETTAMVGDQVFTDIYGANRLGIYTILVDPMSSKEALITRMLQRPLERLIGRVPAGK